MLYSNKNLPLKKKKMKRTVIILSTLVLFAFLCAKTQAQVAINTTGASPDNSAMLEVSSTTKGFLPPKVNTTQMLSIPSPAEGLIVYNTEVKNICYYDGTSWQQLGTKGSFYSVTVTIPAIGNNGSSETPITVPNVLLTSSVTMTVVGNPNNGGHILVSSRISSIGTVSVGYTNTSNHGNDPVSITLNFSVNN